MLRLASDANVHDGILRGLLTIPGLDLTRVQDSLPEGVSDPTILEWAATEKRVLITCDRKTMIGFARERQRRKMDVPGLIVLCQRVPIGLAIADIALIAGCMRLEEIRERLCILVPLRSGS
jgi:hypothetical protein